MARYALINRSSSTVENVIEWDGVSLYDPGPSYTLVKSDTAQIADTWDGNKFTAPVINVQ